MIGDIVSIALIVLMTLLWLLEYYRRKEAESEARIWKRRYSRMDDVIEFSETIARSKGYLDGFIEAEQYYDELREEVQRRSDATT